MERKTFNWTERKGAGSKPATKRTSKSKSKSKSKPKDAEQS